MKKLFLCLPLIIPLIGCKNDPPENLGKPHEFNLPPLASEEYMDVLLDEINISLDSVLRDEEEYQIFSSLKVLKENGKLNEFVEASWGYTHSDHGNLLKAMFSQWDEYRPSVNHWKREYREKYQKEPPQFRTDTTYFYWVFDVLMTGKDVSSSTANKMMRANKYGSTGSEEGMNDDLKMFCFSQVLQNTSEISEGVRAEMKEVFSDDVVMASNARSFDQEMALALLDTTSQTYKDQVKKNHLHRILKSVAIEEMIEGDRKYFLAANYSDSSFKSLFVEWVVGENRKYKIDTATRRVNRFNIHPSDSSTSDFLLEPGDKMEILYQQLKDTGEYTLTIELKGGEFKD